MTKNTTDELREQIQSCFKRNLMQTEGDTELFDTELTIDNLLALISNREKLARIDELREAARHADRMYPECDNVLDHIENRITTLRKELE